ncbi:PAS domain-containing sensor histidine kinase [Arcobacter lacus]|uniref:PAS domain-containing sensor histidine kinase n=1 Tax=Arcobacter lacus TaxID=1912876 RepID=UPI001AE69DA8|nr:PAS domain-containing sensor histidine kinase [Arcobacter lacus]
MKRELVLKYLLLIFYFFNSNLYSNGDSLDSKKIFVFLENSLLINNQIEIDYESIIQIALLALILVGTFIYWNFKLKESEAKFRTLFDIAPIFLNSFDKNGKIILWNKECEKVFGWTFDEIKNKKNSLSLFYDDPKVCEDVMKSFENISNSFEEWYPKTKKGETLVVKWANIKLPNGETINVGLDITQQRNYEMSISENALELKLAKSQLENLNSSLEKRIENEITKNTKQQLMIMQQNKLAQMGEMIENIAHQWRQPLAQINSSVILIDAMLEKYNFKDAMVENKLTEIESLTSYMSKTISDFKNFFNPNKKKTIFKVEEAVQKASDVLKGLIHSYHIQMEISVEKDLKINSYLGELQQVILIIVNNAIDALILMNVHFPKILINAYTDNENIVISIEDNALGINSDLLDKIFEPYFTTKHKAQGTGLGLYIAKMVVENSLLGFLSVENKVNGACFIIRIPKGKV